MTEEEMKAVFLLAGLKVEGFWQIENQYWPNNEHYNEARRKSPWWLVKTEFGLIRIGWRKRVISFDWSDTGLQAEEEAIMGKDANTFTPTLAHAWGYDQAITYLIRLHTQLRRHRYLKEQEKVNGTTS